jgi:tetratricopeptide (TPR) repeat protein
VHLRLANLYTWTDWNWADGEAEFKKAIAVAPSLAEAHAFYAHYLYIMRRRNEGLEEIRRAVEIDPLNELVRSLHGTTMMWRGEFEAALANAADVLRTNPSSPQALNQKAQALKHLHREKESVDADIEWWKARNDTEIAAALERGYAEGGYQAAMRRVAAILSARPSGRGVPMVRLATTYARAGDIDHAIATLERAMAARDPNMPYLSTGPEYDVLRGDPRFQSLVRRLNLPL